MFEVGGELYNFLRNREKSCLKTVNEQRFCRNQSRLGKFRTDFSKSDFYCERLLLPKDEFCLTHLLVSTLHRQPPIWGVNKGLQLFFQPRTGRNVPATSIFIGSWSTNGVLMPENPRFELALVDYLYLCVVWTIRIDRNRHCFLIG